MSAHDASSRCLIVGVDALRFRIDRNGGSTGPSRASRRPVYRCSAGVTVPGPGIDRVTAAAGYGRQDRGGQDGPEDGGGQWRDGGCLSDRIGGARCPTCLLADLGAEVIKIEAPGTGDPSRRSGELRGEVSSCFETNNRGVKSLTPNLKQKEGQAVLHRLVRGRTCSNRTSAPARRKETGSSPRP